MSCALQAILEKKFTILTINYSKKIEIQFIPREIINF